MDSNTSLSTEGFTFRPADLKPELKEKMVAALRPFVVPLIIDGGRNGTGTLVAFGKTCGILTAKHVATAIAKGKKLGTIVERYAHSLEIDASYLTPITTGHRRSDDFGPDLAFLALPPSPFLDQLKARKAFLNLEMDADKKCAEASRHKWGIVLLVGYPQCEQYDGEATPDFGSVTGLKCCFAFCSGEQFHERDGYDYVDIDIDYKFEPRSPVTFAGVSGGSIWRIPVWRKPGEDVGTEFFTETFLMGVAFYESDRVNDKRHIRCHGPKSLYKTFFPEIAKELESGPKS